MNCVFRNVSESFQLHELQHFHVREWHLLFSYTVLPLISPPSPSKEHVSYPSECGFPSMNIYEVIVSSYYLCIQSIYYLNFCKNVSMNGSLKLNHWNFVLQLLISIYSRLKHFKVIKLNYNLNVIIEFNIFNAFYSPFKWSHYGLLFKIRTAPCLAFFERGAVWKFQVSGWQRGAKSPLALQRTLHRYSHSPSKVSLLKSTRIQHRGRVIMVSSREFMESILATNKMKLRQSYAWNFSLPKALNSIILHQLSQLFTIVVHNVSIYIDTCKSYTH